MIYKRCPHCKKRVPEGEKCGCGYKREMPHQIKRGSCTTLPDGRRQGQQSLAFIPALIRTRRSMENLNMLSRFIIFVPAEEDPERFWQLDNLIPLSRSSHDEVHTRYRVSDEEKRKAQEELRELIRVPEWADHPGGYRKSIRVPRLDRSLPSLSANFPFGGQKGR